MYEKLLGGFLISLYLNRPNSIIGKLFSSFMAIMGSFFCTMGHSPLLLVTFRALIRSIDIQGAQREQFTFPPKAEKDEEMEPLALQIDEGYSDSLLKPRTRSFETPKTFALRKTRTGSLDLNIVEPARERKFERAESWDVEKCSPESKVFCCLHQ